MAHTVLQSFIDAVNWCRDNEDSTNFSRLFTLDARWDEVTHLLRAEVIRETRAGNRDYISRTVENQLEDEDWGAFHLMVTSYIEYLRDCSMTSALERYELLSKGFISKLATAYGNRNGAILKDLVLKAAKFTARQAVALDREADTERWQHSSAAQNVITKMFSNALTERGNDEKKKVAIGLANVLLDIQDKMGSTRLAGTIHSNLHQKLLPSNPTDTFFPAAHRCAYAYHLGRYNFSRGHYRKALKQYAAAYDLMPPSALQNRRLTLIHLLATGIILGRFPSEALLDTPEALGLDEVFSPLVQSIKTGHFEHFERALYEHRDFHEFYGTFYDLNARCQVLLWRNLVRLVWRASMQLYTERDGQEKLSCPVHDIWFAANCLRSGLRFDVGGTEISELEVESVLISLIDQGFVEGYVAKGRAEGGVLAAKSRNVVMFPKLENLVTRYTGRFWTEDE